MRNRVLGKTGLVVSELALGTWGLAGEAYGEVSAQDADAVLRRAIELGITLIDTSDAYGAGRMEAAIGDVLKGRDDVLVATRVGVDRTQDPPRKRFEGDWIRPAVERSLKRLKRERIDVLLLHNPSQQALAINDGPEVARDLVKEGKVRHWGVSAGDANIARTAIDKGAEVISLAYGLLHAADVHRIAGDLMVARTGLLAHSVLSYGLLSGSWSTDREFAPGDHRIERWSRLELEERVGQLNALRFLVHGDVPTLRAAALRFVLSNHVLSAAILGPRNIEQLDQLIRESGGGPTYLPDEDLLQVPRTLAKIGVLS